MNNLYKEWFRKGDNDLLNIENNLKAENYPADTVCFHSQQLAEKYLKGFLTFKNIEIEKTHNLLFLYNQCMNIEAGFKNIYEELIDLNNYSVSVRYPVLLDDISHEEVLEAYQNALKVRSYILSIIQFEK